MSFLLPQTRTGVVRVATPVDIHGDRFVDVAVELDDEPGAVATGRVSAGECPADLAAGDRVSVRLVMGVMVRVVRNDGGAAR